MRYKAMFAAGLGIGYVLGSRAGRERYEQIKRTAQRVADNPTVQEAAGLVGAQVTRVSGAAKEFADDKFGGKVPFLKKSDSWEEEDEKVSSPTGWPESAIDRPT